ncbi:unnamed protein product [Didymodactylos carnosus]|uniref:Uncharacterized protein n=1 Tax=Didymodactylos carnosus TaxID=1234261 RepID=A0A815VJ45_9BILA|nr:unnamed protein product [Didymodactylos carnosus]CAF4393134.1 unnamed protein product [Didymodactylos carnosus]
MDGAYVQFEYAIKTAVFIANRKNRNLHQLPQITFRLNMDGTLIGNKHIVAISVNCVEGGPDCQSPKNLVPVGLFEFPKESYELYRKILPKSFLDSLGSVKYVRLNQKDIPVKIKLGGDFMNAVYVFGLAGVQSNFPCIFCTQHKNKLQQPNTTSYFDVQKEARTLEEQKLCLNKKGEKNCKGYKCEPLFGDLFEFSDYIMDTLHMKLRVYDVFMTDILHYASKREKYGKEHDLQMEEKVATLNEHAKILIGKRVFFAYDTKEQLIKLHGRFSGHLQELFFQKFPYDKLLDGKAEVDANKLVEDFREILDLLKVDPLKRKKNLKTVCIEFLQTFNAACLRSNVTPYLHIVGNHLFEFDERENLGAFNMQEVEKGNDLLSRLYFSSTNVAKKPLYTMMQKLYRILEMQFSPDERSDMQIFMNTHVYDIEDDNFVVLPDMNRQNDEQETDYEIITSGSNNSSSDGEEEDETQSDQDLWFNLSNRKILTASRFSSFKRSKRL